ncbi:MAG: hypothetical protein WCI04_05640 [archaeon]
MMNFRGQAALVDSMFFIAIVSAVCTAMFYFAINYGTSTDSLMNSFYSQDFAEDSLKVITYINIFRNGDAVGPDINPVIAHPQFDYMLAMIKEDYVKNKLITLPTKVAIANTIHSALKPFDTSIDYVFYIAKESATSKENKYITMIISTRKCESGCEFNSNVEGKVIKRVYYSCEPPTSDALEKYIFPYAGKVDSATGKISLIDKANSDVEDYMGQSEQYSIYVTGIHLWVAKKIPALDKIIASADEPDPAKREANFNCVVLNTTS